jgi:hypothetical protein
VEHIRANTPPSRAYPMYFWPLLGGLSVVLHLVLWGFSQRLLLATQVANGSPASPIPVQLLTAVPAVSEAVANIDASQKPLVEASETPALATAATPTSPLMADNAITDYSERSPDIPTEPPEAGAIASSQSAEADGAMDTLPLSASGPISDPSSDPVAPSDLMNGAGGQLVPLGISLDLQGHDLPDIPPQLAGDVRLAVRPWLSTCGWSQPGGLATVIPTVTVQMRITVEIDGRISAATILPGQGTGNAAVDNLTKCLVQQGLRLEPARTEGGPHPTSAAILTVQLQPQ